MRFDPSTTPFGVAALLLVALIVVLLRVGRQRAVNRGLAYFFGATALYDLATVMESASTDPLAGAFWAHAVDGAAFADAVLLVGFAVAYHRDADGRDARRVPELALAAGVILALAAALIPGAVYEYSGRVRMADGPLFYVDNALDLVWAVVPFLLARRALRERGPHARSTLLLASTLVFLFLSFDGGSFFAYVYGLALRMEGFGAFHVIRVARIALQLAFILYLLVATRRIDELRRFGTGCALLIVGGGLLGLAMRYAFALGDAGSRGATFAGFALLGLAFLLEPLVIAYALLRHQLLDIDLKIKLGLSRGALAGIFLAVFFVVSQLAQNVLSAEYGLIAGGVATGILLFAIAPLQRVAERFADTAMPRVGPRADLTSKERAYKNALRFALADRAITREEELQLAHLADELGLSTQTATRLRHEVEAERSAG